MPILNPTPEPDLDDAQIVAKGKHAEQLLNDPVFQEAVANAEQNILQDWYNSKDKEERESAWPKLHAVQEVIDALQTLVNAASVLLGRNKS